MASRNAHGRFTFAVFGDCSPDSPNAAPPDIFRQICKEMGLLAPDFVVGLGDYVYGSPNVPVLRRQFDALFTAMSPAQQIRRVPFAFAPGAQDIRGLYQAENYFRQTFGELYYSFDRETSHFIILDSEIVQQEGRIAGEQLAWLKRDLADNADADLTFVFVHRPLFPVVRHIGSALDVNEAARDQLHRLFVEAGVDCVFSGQEHLFDHRERDGLTYIISGGAGSPLHAFEAEGGFHHYLLVGVDGQKYWIEVRRPIIGGLPPSPASY
ncbi:MAG: metallophosphoesterase family protein [Armatimonadota bacterium]